MFKIGEIDGVIIKKIILHNDNRGWLAELFRKDDLNNYGPMMSYISVTKPGIARGPHEHTYQTDYFCFLGKARLFLWDNRKDSKTYMNKQVIENADGLTVIVPPGIVHAYKNIDTTDCLIVNFPDKLFAGWGKKEAIDEIRHENMPESPYRLE
ncbi:MAG: dTDP-4-dehydrorhamnose 3,5-epimerase family protein [Nitrospiraceae bacterium]|nr:dTDP-4-dehydrorhamnose 3,5-epimerase family protein [Nitrospiraceae bacterium]